MLGVAGGAGFVGSRFWPYQLPEKGSPLFVTNQIDGLDLAQRSVEASSRIGETQHRPLVRRDRG